MQPASAETSDLVRGGVVVKMTEENFDVSAKRGEQHFLS